MKEILKNSSLALFAVLIFLALTEATLHLAGLLLLHPQELKNRSTPDSENSFRILTLGESTTADYFSEQEDGAWPRRLEKKLNKLGIKAQVFNAAVGGTSSPLLVAKTPELVEKLRPNLVIAMMGINDNPYLIAQNQQETWEWLQRTHLFKIFHLALGSGYRNKCKLSSHGVSPELASLQKQFIRENPDGALAEAWIENRIQGPEQKALFLMGLTEFYFEKKNFPLASKLIARAFAIFPKNENVAYWKITLSSPPNHPDDGTCAKDATTILNCPDTIFDGLFAKILNCPSLQKSTELNNLLAARGLSLAETARPDLTKVHYQKLFALLSERGISLMAMQYPTMDIGEIEGYFPPSSAQGGSASSKPIFVENKFNFFQAVKRFGYSAVFKDRFATTWGHTSDFGHEMLAASALEGMKKSCKQLKLPQLCQK